MNRPEFAAFIKTEMASKPEAEILSLKIIKWLDDRYSYLYIMSKIQDDMICQKFVRTGEYNAFDIYSTTGDLRSEIHQVLSGLLIDTCTPDIDLTVMQILYRIDRIQSLRNSPHIKQDSELMEYFDMIDQSIKLVQP